MGWRAYRVVLRLLAALHVGAGQVGNLQRARPYVTGKALWGALTARLARDCPELHFDYRRAGRWVNEALAFSYFYPAIGREVDVWPWGETADEFAWRYLDSYCATALSYDRNAAQDASLHEVELVAPYARDGRPVYLVGYIMEREPGEVPWRQALSRLRLGGERGYGWGRVALAGEPMEEDLLFDRYAIATDTARPVLRAEGSTPPPLLAHTLACDQGAGKGMAAQGTIEPLVGRETADAGRFGNLCSAAVVCWAPGATVEGGARLAVASYGMWEAAG